MHGNDLKDMFSRPENDREIRASWERFVRDGGSPGDALRHLVGESWRRCLDANVDPARNQAPSPLVDRDILELRQRHRELLEASKPVMALARDFLSETDTIMLLTDPRGTVIGVEGDPRALTQAEKIHLQPGATWTEAVCGTNAIGTAISLGQPVQIHSAEHFCEGIKRWTCSAAVIRDPCMGQILGAIDVSGLTRTYSPQTLSLVVTAVNRIEAFLAKNEMLIRYRLLERCIGRLSAADGSGVIVVDRYGVPIKLNENAESALASLGIALDMSKPNKFPGFAGAGAVAVLEVAELPQWLRPEWVEPVFDHGERLGSVISVPARSRQVFSNAADARAALDFAGAKGGSAPFRAAVSKAAQLAKSRVPILLLGETGAGKEVFARGIHEAGPMREGPFVALNCGGLSRDLLASELFGYVEGAFTGARRGGMPGKIEAANGGTLFLDELGEMPLELQPHFLRVLEDGQIIRLGDNTPRKVTFRLVAATNRDLRQEVTEGRFRMDLFYRISVTSIRIPALRERAGDIRALATHFLDELCRRHDIPLRRFDPEAWPYLERYAWPGNVRELRNLIESLILMVPRSVILPEDLPPEIGGAEAATRSLGPREEAAPTLRGLERGEFEQISRALADAGGNATLAARHLGIAKSTLYLKLKKYALDKQLASWRSH